MENACRFSQGYYPTEAAPDVPLLVHLQNCPDCQGEFRLVAGAASWSVSVDSDA